MARTLHCLVAMAAVFVAGTPLAQTQGPAGSGAPAVRTTDSAPSSAATEFVRKAAIGNLFEIETSRLALERTQSAEVRAFARQMIDDHGKLAAQMRQTLQQPNRGVPVPTELDPPHAGKLDALRKSEGGEFDRRYLGMQLQAHKQALALHRAYAERGDQPELRSFAETARAIVERHLRHVEALAAGQPGARG
ncbi:hypothetical protein STVA_04890 [Allostella vacuolata]|nr:hypothetical protein STVA_04890 [Stella vacuolata]